MPAGVRIDEYDMLRPRIPPSSRVFPYAVASNPLMAAEPINAKRGSVSVVVVNHRSIAVTRLRIYHRH